MTDETLKENTTHGKAERACKQCGADISHRQMNAMFCCQACKKADYNARHRDKINAIQRDRNKTPESKNSRKAYKAKRSAMKNAESSKNREMKREQLSISLTSAPVVFGLRKCRRCRSGIVGRSSLATYCSDKCAKAAGALRTYLRKNGTDVTFEPIENVCTHCGVPFVSSYTPLIYCGDVCKDAAYYVRIKESGIKAEYDRRYQDKNADKIRERWRDRDRKRMECKLFAMRKRLSIIHRLALRRVGLIKRSSTFDMLGYTPQDLADHLERQFVKGMTWDNRHKWHIDHIVPISTAETEADVIALNQLSNLRPIWAKDNLAKSDKRTHLI